MTEHYQSKMIQKREILPKAGNFTQAHVCNAGNGNMMVMVMVMIVRAVGTVAGMMREAARGEVTSGEDDK